MLKEKFYEEVAPIFGVQSFIIKEAGLTLDAQRKIPAGGGANIWCSKFHN